MANPPLGTEFDALPENEQRTIDKEIDELRDKTLQKGLKFSEGQRDRLRQTLINERSNTEKSRKPSNLSR